MKLWATKYLLEHSEPAYIFEWLSKNQVENPYWSDREELELSLLDRNDPVINLGLALYGFENAVREQLYKEGDETIRLAVLSSPIIKSDFFNKKWITDLIPELLAEWNVENLWALFSNKHLHDDILVQLFERAAPFDSLDEEKWIILCNSAAQNDRLSTPYDDTYIDGFAYGSYHHVFTAAWRLFDKFPKSPQAAGVLSNIAENLIPDKPSGMDVMRVIKKWNTGPDHKDADSFAWVRTYLCNLLSGSKFEALKDSNDFALRKAYYRYLYNPKPEQIKEGFEKDGTDYIDAALNNKYIFMKEDSRQALRRACSDSIEKDDALINYYSKRPVTTV